MSGIAALWLSGPTEPGERVVTAMLERLRHRGPDGADVVTGPNHVLAHLHFWTTPEEVGERQPLSDAETGHRFVFDGRIDNRRDLEKALGDADPSISDARLILQAYRRWGQSCFEKLLGPFCVLIWDSDSGDLLAARDPMGDRTLFYSTVPGGVAIASEEHALLAHPAVSSDLDEETLARYFAIEAPRAGATFFKAIRELPAGSLLLASGGQVTIRPFWTPETPEPIRYSRDEEYAEHLASVLGDAVEARLRSTTQVGISLSGGMDSPSVAALAVERLNRQGQGQRLASFSWVFDEFPECDERRWIEPLVASLGLEATYVVGDSFWPLRNPDTWPLNPSTPLSNAYRALKQALYAAAARRGIRTLLTGVFSDRLFAGWESWLASRVAEGHVGDLFQHVVRLAASRDSWRVWRDPALRALLRRVAPLQSRRTPRRNKPAWLTPRAWKVVQDGQARPGSSPERIRERRTAQVFSDLSRLSPSEIFFASQTPLEIRDPFRDLRVARFMLAIPPDQLERGTVQKYVLRQAMKGRLPSDIVERTERTPLDPVYRKRFLGPETGKVDRLLRSPDALWRGLVEEEWLLGGFPQTFREMPDGRALLVPFFAAAANLWGRAAPGGLDMSDPVAFSDTLDVSSRACPPPKGVDPEECHV